MTHHLAQLNIATLHQPLDHPASAGFVDNLDPINSLAEASDGFVWRLTDEDGQSSSYVAAPDSDDPLLIVNYSIWRDVESLHDFVFKTAHKPAMQRRREWFEAPAEPSTVCWWTPEGTIPDLAEAFDRLAKLRANGPTADAFGLMRPFPAPS